MPSTLLFLALALGLLWRLLDYASNFPFWGDEAAVALNLWTHNYRELVGGLQHNQVAPLLFLWIERWILLHVGTQEWALRLPALLAGLLAFPIFYRLARHLLSRYGIFIALSLLALSLDPVRYAVMLKPYSLDFLAASSLLLCGLNLLRQPASATPALALLFLGPLFILLSYPSIFISASIALVTCPRMLRRGSTASRSLWALALLITFALFALCLLSTTQHQFDASHAVMEDYWHNQFVPLNRTLPWWLVKAHFSEMMSYPIPGRWGIACLILPLTLVGIARIARKRPAAAALLLAPFALTLLAATLHRYPYGGAARVQQHLAPSIFLFASAGMIWTVHRVLRLFGPAVRLARAPLALAVSAIIGLCILYGTVALAIDCRGTFHTHATNARSLARRIFIPDLLPQDQVVISSSTNTLEVIEWYFRLQPHLPSPRGTLRFDGHIDADALIPPTHLWLFSFHLRGRTPTLPLATLPATALLTAHELSHQTFTVEDGIASPTPIDGELRELRLTP